MTRKPPAVAAMLAVLAAAGTAAPASDGNESPQTQRVVAGEKYRAGWLHRLLLGNEYRHLWTTPLELPVLDLKTFAGGLKPVSRVGHGQSKALAMRGENGIAYTFRPVVKDPSGLLPAELRESFARRIVDDQMASGHPAGHVIVPPILDAVGGLHNTPRLVVMPDDPALGEFREDFRGLVGDIEQFAGQKNFRGALEVISGQEMWNRLQAGPEVRADSRAYLVMRLVDHLIGDWDRHRNQWNWARMPDKPLWQPVPEDRDQAFVRFEGLVIGLIRPQLPLLVDFGPGYPSLHGLTFDGWDVDRRILAELEKPAWDEIAATVKAQITDEVLEKAARGMPPEYFAKDGPGLIAALKRRRDRIPEQADRFYRFLVSRVDVRCTDQPEIVEVLRSADGDLEVRVAVAATPGAPYFHRRFRRTETHEVRIYLYGGDDRVVTSGPRGGITVRVIGGDGSDVVDDSASGGTRVYDASTGENRVERGPGTSWDKRPYTPPVNPSGDWFPPRDWGRRTITMLRVTAAPDIGLFLSAGILSKGYGFRKDPFHDSQTIRVGYATAAKTYRATYDGDFPLENSKLRWSLHARASGIDILRFYGFGNETPSANPDNIFKIEQDTLVFRPALTIPLASRCDFSLGPIVKYAITENRSNPIMAVTDLYGDGRFGEVGGTARIDLDRTDRPGLPRKGVRLSTAGAFYPKAWDLTSPFGEVHGEATTFLAAPIPGNPTLIVKGGGKRVWGTFPFFESAFLGGGHFFGGDEGDGNAAVRGLRRERYAGNGSLFGSAELRLTVARAVILIPGELGLFGLVDTGRVFLDAEDSNAWHTGIGGGVFFASPNRNNAIFLTVARSEKKVRYYLRSSFGF